MTSADSPLVSVLTPVFNGEPYLEECIESVLRQTYSNWEYVVVDNRSTDRTREIAESYAARDARIRVITNPEFVGVIENHNIACRQMAPGSRYCKILQADDWLFPGCLAEMVALAEAHPSVGLVGSYVLHGNGVRCDGLPYPSPVVPGREACRMNLLGHAHFFLSPTALMVRADLVRARDEYYREAHLHADVEACYEVLRDTDFGFVHGVLSFVRRHEDSLTASHAQRFNLLSLANLEMLVEFGPGYLTQDELAGRLRSQLRRYYDSLAYALYRSRDRRRIWQEHAKRMAALGRPLSRLELAKGLLRGVFTRLAR
jgi:glycosyltransferase involved in cell wall biosynthesis